MNYADFAKGKIVGSPPGLAKLLVEKGSDRIQGFHMIGPRAADLIHEVVVAMNTPGAKAERVREQNCVMPPRDGGGGRSWTRTSDHRYS
ncbi:hypothetical protein [Litchfieldella rifensis]|uniref:Pyridine nucleotide-disulphide oxidoreductase dimerisation domain-containing protein n=1 Tax=Litchfieldella rifensis TaxID=762643 RepID=A0ABV7LRJ0_9GAMM